MRVLKNLRDYLLIKRSGLFDLHYYLENNVDVRRADIDPLWHFVNYGWQEGRNPSNDFIVNDYLSANPDVSKSDINPLLHYIKFGLKENRQLSLISTPLSISEPECNRDLSKCLSLLDKRLKTNNLVLHDLVDIVIPVYNGLEFLPSLFESIINNTDQNFHLIIIDDCSTDPGIYPLLEKIQELVPGTTLIKHPENRGFVNSVNEGAMLTQGNFVILNTDTEVPQGWLSRLMYQLNSKSNVASVTPMTNSGTLVSFPEIWQDNDLFNDRNLDFIDLAFQETNPDQDIELPTGVGFCMAFNKLVWAKIGPFNEEIFGKGYGEENDWCMRAIKAGYRNLLAPNLFVYHKHGGSFSADKKKKLCAENLLKLNQIHPEYSGLVEKFQKEDPIECIRNAAILQLFRMENPKYRVLIFDHAIGGGANYYRERVVEERLEGGQLILIVTYQHASASFEVEIKLGQYAITLCFKDIKDLRKIAEFFSVNKIIINNLVTYPDITAVIDEIENLITQSNPEMDILIHDYYLLCPAVNLLNLNGEYCGVPAFDVCDKCLPDNNNVATHQIKDIRIWRNEFTRSFNRASKIIAFSDASRDIFLKAYPSYKEKIEVLPHTNFIKFDRFAKYSFDNPLTIGVVGVLSYAKGNKVISQIADELAIQQPDAKIVIVGYADPEITKPNVFQTGKYNPIDLPSIIEENKINICLLGSIWPETFSYVTSELMQLNMPLVAFDLGAPAERIREYRLGKILSIIDPKSAVNELISFYSDLKKITQEETPKRTIVPLPKRVPSDMPKAMTVLSANHNDACGYLRIRAPYELNGYKIFRSGLDYTYIEKNIQESDLLVVQRDFPGNYSQFIFALEKIRSRKKPFIYEIDDFLFNLGPYHPEYMLTKYRQALFPMLEALERADLVTVTTESLKEKLSQYNNNILVLPNFLDDRIWAIKDVQVEDDPSKVISIGYMGGTTHGPDIQLVVSVVDKLLTIYGNKLEVKFFGLTPPKQLRFHPQVKWIKPVSYEYPVFVKWFQKQKADIFIAPLMPTDFNRYKSCIKYLEYTALGSPGVYSDLEPYNSVICHGENGLLAKDSKDFFELLKALIESPKLRFSIAKNAVADIKTNWTLSGNKTIWQNAVEAAESCIQPDYNTKCLLSEINAQIY